MPLKLLLIATFALLSSSSSGQILLVKKKVVFACTFGGNLTLDSADLKVKHISLPRTIERPHPIMDKRYSNLLFRSWCGEVTYDELAIGWHLWTENMKEGLLYNMKDGNKIRLDKFYRFEFPQLVPEFYRGDISK